MADLSDVGPDKKFKHPSEKYDSEHGASQPSKAYDIPVDDRITTTALPMAPKSAPFKVK